jgi:GDP-4-dehydro-6-deoxy-D-mannose reductase
MSDVVSGAGGFAGRALVRELAALGRNVTAWCRTRAHERELFELGAHDVRVFDLASDAAHEHAQQRELGRELERSAPQRVFHLAALASPRACEAEPRLAHTINVDATRRLLGAVARGTHVVYVSSAAVYAPSARPLAENSALGPRGVYAATKLAGEELAQSAAANGAHVVIARPFNHAGPGQATEYALPSFVRRLVRFRENGGAIEVGDLDAVRDFMHVRDTVRAYTRIEACAPSGAVVNVCSGRASRMHDLFDGLARRILGADGVQAARRALTVSPRLAEAPSARASAPRTQCEASSCGSSTDEPSGSTVPAVSSLVGNPYRLATLPFAPLFGLDELLDGLVEEAGGAVAKPR